MKNMIIAAVITSVLSGSVMAMDGVGASGIAMTGGYADLGSRWVPYEAVEGGALDKALPTSSALNESWAQLVSAITALFHKRIDCELAGLSR